MDELLKKISSYNLFNFLLPGIIFVVLVSRLFRYPVPDMSILTGAFTCYFVGMVISRFGSLMIEPFLKWIKFIDLAEYDDFVVASKKDEKVEVLLEVSNTFRTFCALFALLLLLTVYLRIIEKFPNLTEWHGLILAVILLAVFLFSFRKQTSYLTKRIKVSK